jgi:hypothetical protein
MSINDKDVYTKRVSHVAFVMRHMHGAPKDRRDRGPAGTDVPDAVRN